eukprot:Pgem_evm1s8247
MFSFLFTKVFLPVASTMVLGYSVHYLVNNYEKFEKYLPKTLQKKDDDDNKNHKENNKKNKENKAEINKKITKYGTVRFSSEGKLPEKGNDKNNNNDYKNTFIDKINKINKEKIGANEQNIDSQIDSSFDYEQVDSDSENEKSIKENNVEAKKIDFKSNLNISQLISKRKRIIEEILSTEKTYVE